MWYNHHAINASLWYGGIHCWARSGCDGGHILELLPSIFGALTDPSKWPLPSPHTRQEQEGIFPLQLLQIKQYDSNAEKRVWWTPCYFLFIFYIAGSGFRVFCINILS